MNTENGVVQDETHVYVFVFHIVRLMTVNCRAVIHPAVCNVDVVDKRRALLQTISLKTLKVLKDSSWLSCRKSSNCSQRAVYIFIFIISPIIRADWHYEAPQTNNGSSWLTIFTALCKMESVLLFDMAEANLSYLQRFVALHLMISIRRNTFLPHSRGLYAPRPAFVSFPARRLFIRIGRIRGGTWCYSWIVNGNLNELINHGC